MVLASFSCSGREPDWPTIGARDAALWLRACSLTREARPPTHAVSIWMGAPSRPGVALQAGR